MLQHFAATHNVKLIALSIGGNNFNFAGIVTTCIEDFLESTWFYDFYCSKESSVTNNFTTANVNKVKGEITTAIKNVATAMTNAGYTSSQYTILVQNYPSPIPNGSEFRYTQSGYSRQTTGGCGFWNTDANYANATMLPTIDSTVLGAAAAAGLSNVKTMELGSAFNSHRLCDKGVGLLEEEGLSNWKSTGAVDKSEWFNQIRTLETLIGPYELQEDIHPNYWAQLGLRNCLTQAYNGGSAQGRYVYDLRIWTQLSGRAEHVAALIGQRGRRGEGLAPAPAPSPLRARSDVRGAAGGDRRVSASESRVGPRVRAVMREGEQVTPLELFFDLVFVLALTQCTTLMAATATWEGLLEGPPGAGDAVVVMGRLRLADQRRGPRGGAGEAGDVPGDGRLPDRCTLRAGRIRRRTRSPSRSPTRWCALRTSCCSCSPAERIPRCATRLSGWPAARRSARACSWRSVHRWCASARTVGSRAGARRGRAARDRGRRLAARARSFRRAPRRDRDHRARRVDRRDRRGRAGAHRCGNRRRSRARDGAGRDSVVGLLRRHRDRRRQIPGACCGGP